MKTEMKTPRWETAILVVSFGLVWAYFLARQSRNTLSMAWNFALLLAVVALGVVLVRRIRRTVASIRAVEKRQ